MLSDNCIKIARDIVICLTTRIIHYFTCHGKDWHKSRARETLKDNYPPTLPSPANYFITAIYFSKET